MRFVEKVGNFLPATSERTIRRPSESRALSSPTHDATVPDLLSVAPFEIFIQSGTRVAQLRPETLENEALTEHARPEADSGGKI